MFWRNSVTVRKVSGVLPMHEQNIAQYEKACQEASNRLQVEKNSLRKSITDTSKIQKADTDKR